jgi:hypothetical protein
LASLTKMFGRLHLNQWLSVVTHACHPKLGGRQRSRGLWYTPIRAKKFGRSHLYGKKLGIMVCIWHPHYSGKCRTGESQSRSAWAKGKSKTLSCSSRKGWRCGSRAQPHKCEVLTLNTSAASKQTTMTNPPEINIKSPFKVFAYTDALHAK